MVRPVFLLLAIVALLGLLPSAQAAAAVLQLDDSHGATYLYPGKVLSVLEDPTRSMTIGAVAASPDFAPMHPLPNEKSAYWLRLTYTTANTTKKWLLFMGFKPETVSLYVRNPDGTYAVTTSGNAIPFADRPVKYYGAVLLNLPPAPAPATVYIRVTTREPELTIAIDSLETMEAVSRTTFAIIVGLDSIILSLLLSCLVFYATSRDRTYLLYMVYLVCELLYRSNDQGLAAAWFWPHWGISSLTLGALLDGARIVAATTFLRAFLNLRQVSPWLDKLNIAFAAIFGVLALACFAGLPVRASWLSELSLVYVPLWLVSALYAWRRGERQAILIAVGWSLLMLFSVGFGLKQLGFARGNIIVELIISQGRNFGVGLQTLFLSLAISTDLRRLMRSRQYFATLAAIDALTGLSNRRAFEDALEREWNRAARAQEPLSLLIVDVDYFKKYNDEQGHAEGDLLLRTVAQRGDAVLRHAGDLFCRYGGDEFAVILPESDEATAMRIAERIRAAIFERAIPNPGSPLAIVTLSVGVATGLPSDGLESFNLFERADRALYAAKGRGRNCCASSTLLAAQPR